MRVCKCVSEFVPFVLFADPMCIACACVYERMIIFSSHHQIRGDREDAGGKEEGSSRRRGEVGKRGKRGNVIRKVDQKERREKEVRKLRCLCMQSTLRLCDAETDSRGQNV